MKGVAVGAACPDVGSSGEIARFFTVAAWGHFTPLSWLPQSALKD
uniref:Uncharacterized protein n=1 Tax=Rhodocyclus tenuis TaxID=1066 RepID=A0A840G897_RHOTE|nr:hypothetical protein [Rhodocyclus tenuis]